MAAVMQMSERADRTAFRRLSKQQWQAEDRLISWAAIVRRDRVPCDWPRVTVMGKEIARRGEWLETARRDAWEEPDWFAEFNAALRQEFEGVRMTFLRRRYVDCLTTDQARTGLNMSRHAAHKLLDRARKIANDSLGA